MTPQATARSIAGWVARHELWLLAAAAPFLLFPGRWTLPAFGAIAFAWLCRCVASGRLSMRTPVDAPIVGMLLMALLGLYASVEASLSLAGLWRILLGVAVFYSMVNALRTEAQRRWLLPALILGSLGLALMALLGTEWEAVRLFQLPRLYGLLPRILRDVQDENAFHPRIMGMALATWFPVPLALLWFAPSRRHRAWAGLAVLIMGVPLLLTQSLQAAAGIACAVLFLAVCRSRRTLVGLPLVLVAVVLGWAAYGPQRAVYTLLSVDNPLGIAAALRLDMWSRAWAMVRNMPYTGIGLDTFPVVQSNFYPGMIIGAEPHAHNLFLQVALDLGLPGLVAFLSLVLGVGYAAFRACRQCTDALRRALLLGAIGGLLSTLAIGCLDTIWTAKPSVLLWVLLGLAAVLSAPVDGSPQAGPTPRSAAWQGWVVPVVLLVLLLLPGLLVSRGGPRTNWAALRAHKLLWSAQWGESPAQEELSAVAAELNAVAQLGADDVHLYNLLGRILGWLGQYSEAVEALEQQVCIDGQSALARYDPAESLRRRIVGREDQDRWQDAARLYQHWLTRFPERAELYVLLAVLRAEQQGNRQGAAAVLKAGIERQAQPGGLLQYYLGQLGESAAAGD